MGFRVVEIQPTPNPNALKFVLDRPVSEQPISFFNQAAAAGHPLATELFAIEGVSSLLLLGDFITINKSSEARWADITPKAKVVLAQSG
ncbi:MAG TPA: NifU N-terminal domain-containing protein [Tepidisphaeraceae bacterium]|nr:NifU N-terminal domain-containing protein [Tepidisphaeraceae bacterium]